MSLNGLAKASAEPAKDGVRVVLGSQWGDEGTSPSGQAPASFEENARASL